MILSGYTLVQFLLNIPIKYSTESPVSFSKALTEELAFEKDAYESIHDNGFFKVHEYTASSRNDVYKVYINESVVIVKQLKDKKNKYDLLREREFYQLSLFENLNSKYKYYDVDNDILVLTNFKDFTRLTNSETEQIDVRQNLIVEITKRLYKLHYFKYCSTIEKEKQKNPYIIFKKETPLLLNKDSRSQEIAILRQSSSYLLRKLSDYLETFFCILKTEDFSYSYSYSHSHLVHNDLKFDNILYREDNNSHLFDIIDWELISIGDLHWDLGVFMSIFIDSALKEGGGGNYPYNMTRCEHKRFVNRFLKEYYCHLQNENIKEEYFRKKVIFYSIVYLLDQAIVSIRFKNADDSKWQPMIDRLLPFLKDFHGSYQKNFNA